MKESFLFSIQQNYGIIQIPKERKTDVEQSEESLQKEEEG